MNTATESNSVPKGWVTLAVIGLVIAAIAGVYLGAERSLNAHDLPSDTDTLSAVPNVTNAKPLADTAADEARIRAIVHDEVASALKSAAPPRPKPVVKPDDDDASASTTASDATAALNAAAAGRPLTAPKATTTPKATTADGLTRPARPPVATNPYPPTASTPN